MRYLKIFFRSTRFFWIISRLVLGVIFCYCAYFLLEEPETDDYFIAGFFILYAAGLLWLFFSSLFTRRIDKWLKIFTGTTSVLIGVSVAVMTASVFGTLDYVMLIFLPIWFLMAGIYDLFSIKNLKKIKNFSEPTAFDGETSI